ncbi:MAG: peptidylprolyl isomerase [Bdellovibrionales bacterium]|nr:peptidylprolyl isomerase [Bdellovibrionales bacterium]
MLHKWFLTFLFLGLLASPATAQVVAKVGSKSITLQDFKTKYDEVKRQTINPPDPELFLEDLIRYEIGVQEAEKRNLRNDPIVQERINQEMYKALLEKSIGDKVNKIKVNEKEMKAFYQQNPEVRLSHILIEFKPGASAKEKSIAEKRANDIYKEVQKSKRPFQELVKLYSDDTLSKENGGDIGFQSKVTLVPPIYDTVMKMKVGQVRGIVETRYGFHILKLVEKGSYDNANKRQIRAAVFDSKRKDIFDDFFSGLKKKYKISTNKSALKKLK